MIDIDPTRVDAIEDAQRFLIGEGLQVDATAPLAFVREKKPEGCYAPAVARQGSSRSGTFFIS